MAALIYLATATMTPRLERTLAMALAYTTDPADYRWIVVRGTGAHGPKLDRALAVVPSHAEWLVTLDDDVAPLAPGWLPACLAGLGSHQWGGIAHTLWGTPHPAAGFYRVAWLREIGASFVPGVDTEGRRHDVGTSFGLTVPFWSAPLAPRAEGPWWLRRADAIRLNRRIVLAHLGGGTIGSTRWRPPVWLWERLVRRHVRSHGIPPRHPAPIVLTLHGSPRHRRRLRQSLRAATGW